LAKQLRRAGETDTDDVFDRGASHDGMEGAVQRGMGHSGALPKITQRDPSGKMCFDVAEEFADGFEGRPFGTGGSKIAPAQEDQQAHEGRQGRKPVAGLLFVQFGREFRDDGGSAGQIVRRKVQMGWKRALVAQVRFDSKEGLIAGDIRQRMGGQPEPPRVEENIDKGHRVGVGVSVRHFTPNQKDIARRQRVVASLGQMASFAGENHDELVKIMPMQLRGGMTVVPPEGQRKVRIGENGGRGDRCHG